MVKNFRELFPQKKVVIGMIHLAGGSRSEKLKRALDELAVYAEEGVHGAIVEDYHGSREDIENVLKFRPITNDVVLGVNVLSKPYSSFELASKYEAKFVQFDSVMSNRLNLTRYDLERKAHPEIAVLGGVIFKRQKPTGRTLEEDISEGISRCEAIVTTGEDTGIETPIDKLRDFRRVMSDYPLIVGAGVNAENAVEQLTICDGAIVGSYFKNGETMAKVDRKRVRELMSIVRGFN